MAKRVQTRIPGVKSETETALNQIIAQLSERLELLEGKPPQRETQIRNFTAREWETILLEAPGTGLVCSIVRATHFNRGARITFIQKSANPVTFRAIDGLVNDHPFVISNAPGTYDAVSDGETGWVLDQGIGPAGVAGAPGTPGTIGPQGPPGNDGGEGPEGQPGRDGPPGANGSPGAPGATGPQGVQGPPGQDGADGQDGAPGPPGPSSPGTPGATGAAGPQGPPGLDGVDGRDGAPGPPGATGATGTASLPVIQPGSFIGLQVDAGGAATAIEITGLEGGENIRFDTQITDTTSSGAIAVYTLTEAATTIQMNAGVVNPVISGFTALSNGKQIIWNMGAIGANRVRFVTAVALSTGLVCPNDVDLILGPRDCATFTYTGVSNRWKCTSVSRHNIRTVDDWTVLTTTNGLAVEAGFATESNPAAGDILLNATSGVLLKSGATQQSTASGVEIVSDTDIIATTGNTRTIDLNAQQTRIQSPGGGGGLLQLKDIASGLGVAGYSSLASVNTVTPSQLTWGDSSAGAAWPLNVHGVTTLTGGISSATNSSVGPTIPTFTMPANTSRVGTTYSLEMHGVYTRGATATAQTFVIELVLNTTAGSPFTLYTTSATTTPGDYGFYVRTLFTILSIGATATYIHNTQGTTQAFSGAAVPVPFLSLNKAAFAGTINSTTNVTIRLQPRTTTGVAATVVTCTNYVVTRMV